MSITQVLGQVKMFLPVSFQIICWYIFVIFYMLVDLIITVLVTCFNDAHTQKFLYLVVNNILPIILIIDILISFNTGFIRNGKIVLDRKIANKDYIMTIYFYCDIIALITSIARIPLQNTVMKQITIFDYVVFVKLANVFYIDSLFKKYIIKSFNKMLLYEVGKNFIILAMLSHFIGSFYFYIDVLMYQNNWYTTDNLWIFSSYAYPGIYTSDFWIQYTYSYYVACVTLSGIAYGDILPLNPHQTIFIFCCYILPMLVYSYVYASIFNILFDRRSTSAQIRKYKLLAKEYMKSLGVTQKVINKVITYLQFTHKKNMIVDTTFIEGLAPTIKNKYLHKILEGKFQYQCFQPILSIACLDFDYLKQNIFPIIRQDYFPERFSLLNYDKLKIYYINTGKVVQVVKLGEDNKLSKPIHKYSYVAKTAFFTNQIPVKKLSYESNSFVMAHSIDYKQFKLLAKQKMPSFNEAFCFQQWKIIDEKQYEKMNQKCYFCDSISHILKDCPQLSIERDIASVIKHRHINQQRQTFNRDHLSKNQLQKRPNMMKKQRLVRKLSNLNNELDCHQKRSKKIFQSANKKVRNQLFDLFSDPEFYTYLAEFSIKEKNIGHQIDQKQVSNKFGTLNRKHRNQFEKVCIWDKFYPQRNIST